ncbi:hypothetical protein FYK55_27195 [Roseiconus nitratireducens]|uniref:Plasmid related protein n=2 Tax=Roseiconus nitratireducens TaxID=2605748 RepID=A0A5M6CTG4_9BACT|nr:hypothetical protein FYK55_27195 [Roseiconus nitratireducens]
MALLWHTTEIIMSKPLFPLGRVTATPGCLELLDKNNQAPSDLLDRHVRGDWGIVDPDDAQANNLALEHGERLLSSYELLDGSKVWVITEWDRSATTLLRPSDY